MNDSARSTCSGIASCVGDESIARVMKPFANAFLAGLQDVADEVERLYTPSEGQASPQILGQLTDLTRHSEDLCNLVIDYLSLATKLSAPSSPQFREVNREELTAAIQAGIPDWICSPLRTLKVAGAREGHRFPIDLDWITEIVAATFHWMREVDASNPPEALEAEYRSDSWKLVIVCAQDGLSRNAAWLLNDSLFPTPAQLGDRLSEASMRVSVAREMAIRMGGCMTANTTARRFQIEYLFPI